MRGSTTRNIPWLNELVPEPVIEMPDRLARKLAVKIGEWVKVLRPVASSTVKAVVTPRMKALKIGEQEVTIVWMPYNWGFQGLSTGPSVNHLTIDAVGSRRRHAGDEGLPGQRSQGAAAGHARAGSREEAMSIDVGRLAPVRSGRR